MLANRSWGDKPFYLAVGFAKPHLPFAAYERHFDAFDAVCVIGGDGTLNEVYILDAAYDLLHTIYYALYTIYYMLHTIY